MPKKRVFTADEMARWDRASEALDVLCNVIDRMVLESGARLARLEALAQEARLEAMTAIDTEGNIDRSPLPYWKNASKLEAR